MITKKSLRKQVIVLMSVNNKTKFIKDSNTHIVNINKALKNIKLEVKADFIQTDQIDIIISTNKVAALLDLQTIEQYIKKYKPYWDR